MNTAKEPTTSYIADEDGSTLEITEYDLKDKYILMDAFDDPNYTQVPNQLLGSWERDAEGKSTFIPGMLSDMSESELKVCLALCRLTYGFHRELAPAALSMLQKMTGMSRQGVLNGIERLTNRGLFLKAGKSKGSTVWQRGDAASQRSRPVLVNEVDRSSQRSRPYKESIKKEENSLSSAKSEEELPADDSYTITYYFKNKEHVRAVGNWTNGPWAVGCDCGNSVQIDQMGVAAECRCGMHEYVLTKTKPETKIKRDYDAVEAYLLIAGRKRGSIAQEWLDEIAATVTDVPFWRRVVKEYCGQGWNRGNVSKMLNYYKERKIPGTRQKLIPEDAKPDISYENGKKVLTYADEEQKGGPRITYENGVRVLNYD